MEEAIKVFFVMSALAGAGAVGYLGVVLVHTLGRRLNPDESPAISEEEIQYLRDQAEEVDLLRHRVAELENRMDFAERVLPRPAGAPPGPLEEGDFA